MWGKEITNKEEARKKINVTWINFISILVKFVPAILHAIFPEILMQNL